MITWFRLVHLLTLAFIPLQIGYHLATSPLIATLGPSHARLSMPSMTSPYHNLLAV